MYFRLLEVVREVVPETLSGEHIILVQLLLSSWLSSQYRQQLLVFPSRLSEEQQVVLKD